MKYEETNFSKLLQLNNIKSGFLKYDNPQTPLEGSLWAKHFLKSPNILEPQLNRQSRKLHSVVSAYVYGDSLKVVMVKSPPTPKKRTEGNFKPDDTSRAPEQSEERFKQSLSRARARVYELAMCNEFTHFCTFTQDKKMRDRFSLAEFRKDFAQYVRNLNRSRGKEFSDPTIKYLLIPEQHKNGAWHMHGLLQGLTERDLRAFKVSEKIPERIKKTIRGGTAVYDWTGYRRRFGYFTATEIKDKSAVAKYITKYLTKEMTGKARAAGEHLFFASQGLQGRTQIFKETAPNLPIIWQFENEYVCVSEFKIEDLAPEFWAALFGAEKN